MRIDAILLDARDNVATAVQDLAAGQRVSVRFGTEIRLATVAEGIPYGHKFATRPIRRGDDILKYGEVIGRASADIAVGRHAHVQNIESRRGRGDLAGGGRREMMEFMGEFMGYRRAEGTVGTRNLVGVLSAVVCVNEVVEGIVRQVQGTARFTHHQGCCQTPLDIRRVNRTLIGLGRNPNLHSVIIISLGCESTALAEVVEGIRAAGKRVEHLVVQEVGGAARTTAAGILLAQEMVRDASLVQRVPCPIGALVMGMKCGSSDTTSGLVPNPAIGVASDLLVAAGGVSILGEVTEFIGAEHILARHAANEAVGRQILDLVTAMEKRAMAVGEDIRGGQPTGGNIKGGLTTIEEKSLGAIAKAGTAPIQAVYDYGERPRVRGLVVMDSPGREPEILTGLAAAGANVIVFATGRGAPQGFPFVPVLKITASRTAAEKMQDHIDMDLSAVFAGTDTIPDAGRRIFEELARVASGAMTKAEISGYVNSMDIYMLGPVI